MRPLERPHVGDVIAVTWLDSGTRTEVEGVEDAREIRCHRATCYGQVVSLDGDTLRLYAERYDDGSGVAEAVWWPSVVDMEVLRRHDE